MIRLGWRLLVRATYRCLANADVHSGVEKLSSAVSNYRGVSLTAAREVPDARIAEQWEACNVR